MEGYIKIYFHRVYSVKDNDLKISRYPPARSGNKTFQYNRQPFGVAWLVFSIYVFFSPLECWVIRGSCVWCLQGPGVGCRSSHLQRKHSTDWLTCLPSPCKCELLFWGRVSSCNSCWWKVYRNLFVLASWVLTPIWGEPRYPAERDILIKIYIVITFSKNLSSW